MAVQKWAMPLGIAKRNPFRHGLAPLEKRDAA